DEWNAELDYVLALSLQCEDNPRSNTAADCWESNCTTDSVSSGRDEIVLLPCEFCEELYPAEELILHQTGCNPASAFASFSKRSSSPDPPGCDGPHAVGSRSCRSPSSSQPQALQAEGNIMIPCEFCGVQLEEEMLFHHQHHCDLRPDSPTATPAPPQLWSPHANTGREEPPELPRRRSRCQG
ncbi:TRAD1 protein, partial [Rhinopomastus cyanomelas]|nr:TRAD1 protein [Rhinopomastus cyanomelas]